MAAAIWPVGARGWAAAACSLMLNAYPAARPLESLKHPGRVASAFGRDPGLQRAGQPPAPPRGDRRRGERRHARLRDYFRGRRQHGRLLKASPNCRASTPTSTESASPQNSRCAAALAAACAMSAATLSSPSTWTSKTTRSLVRLPHWKRALPWTGRKASGRGSSARHGGVVASSGTTRSTRSGRAGCSTSWSERPNRRPPARSQLRHEVRTASKYSAWFPPLRRSLHRFIPVALAARADFASASSWSSTARVGSDGRSTALKQAYQGFSRPVDGEILDRLRHRLQHLLGHWD